MSCPLHINLFNNAVYCLKIPDEKWGMACIVFHSWFVKKSRTKICFILRNFLFFINVVTKEEIKQIYFICLGEKETSTNQEIQKKYFSFVLNWRIKNPLKFGHFNPPKKNKKFKPQKHPLIAWSQVELRQINVSFEISCYVSQEPYSRQIAIDVLFFFFAAQFLPFF